jgi:outer membrane protein OmpA-like peptidoglycan-associated protein
MKCRVLQAVITTALMGIFLPVWAQKNYYVMVGAFSTEGNETEFKTQLPVFNQDTAYAMRDQQNVVHLYVLHTTSEEMAIEKSTQLQKSIEELRLNGGNGKYESLNISKSPESSELTFKAGISNTPEALAADASSSKDAGSSGAMATPLIAPKSQMFKFSIETADGQSVPGKVHFVDFARERDLATYNTSTYTDLINPGNNSDMALVCGIFGYKQSEKVINYSSPSEIEGAYLDENGAWVIPYTLKRLEKGDVSVMYNVAFHKDAVVMLPVSQSDLDELTRMMYENPDYEITVHGHCNGKNDRKIIALAAQDRLFDVTGSKKIHGSAKMLSNLRAQAVKDYLVMHGIDPKRIKTYAWGGRYMLVDSESSYSKLNDRIEIEIRKD